MKIKEKKVPRFFNLKEAQAHYLHTYHYGKEELTWCDYLNEETSEEFCKSCEKCLYKNSPKAKVKRQNKNFKKLKRIVIDIITNASDTIVDRQAAWKNALTLARIIYQTDPDLGRKLKKFVDKIHFTLTKNDGWSDCQYV